MEQIGHQNLQTFSHTSRSQFLKKIIIQLFVSVSVFSLLFSNSSRFSLLHSFNFYFSTVPVQLFSRTIDKNCMFLLCNGLLVFVTTLSGLDSSFSKYNDHSSVNESVNNYEDDTATSLVLAHYSKEPLLEREDMMAKEKVDDEERRENKECIHREAGDRETQQFIVEDEAEESRESGFLITSGKENSDEVLVEEDDDHQREVVIELDENFLVSEEEDYEEEEEEEENEMLSTEELNKKFDEFIRKMKEEIRIEAQQQLVMVS
ncbi:uncharacterized protein LOC110612154 [Manihot esculenta]|uniref:Uncharacterized protein n=1 Tax=Manihot esculenta TaxID=3983 RepID=A0ACB7HZY2_MANES|nr:uncharacterized protein LOC110612154 [Manihot esculenta]KAG8658367.1 hypothetical protein MANES_03G140301v8 [Manihot esculenta]